MIIQIFKMYNAQNGWLITRYPYSHRTLGMWTVGLRLTNDKLTLLCGLKGVKQWTEKLK